MDKKKRILTPSDRLVFNEKSKYAARSRREKENLSYAELSKLLPLPETISDKLDKASVVKLTSSYLKAREILMEDYRYKSNLHDEAPLPFDFIKTLDDFFILLDQNGKIAYISENVMKHLGLPQLSLMGSNVYDYIHLGDHDELMRILSQFMHCQSPYKIEKSFCLRMRCALAKRSAGLMNGLFKAIHFNGYLKNDVKGNPCLLAVGKCLTTSPLTSVHLNWNTFSFRVGLDLKISFIDDWIQMMGYKPLELVDKSLYDYVHAQDVKFLRLSHQQSLVKGQSITKYYRFLCKFGGYIWLQSELVVIYKLKVKPHSIIALNHVISGIEEGNLILSNNQKNYHLEPSLPNNLNNKHEDCMLPTTLSYLIENHEINTYSTTTETHPGVYEDITKVEVWNEVFHSLHSVQESMDQ
ncbi:single-minded homolog 1-like [Onthophagus taurus]|uniref:single-minded homolog 1-like n=1 Tax=Onthophagus taurus TaxID=166361 RepID=UPI0039BEC7FB